MCGFDFSISNSQTSFRTCPYFSHISYLIFNTIQFEKREILQEKTLHSMLIQTRKIIKTHGMVFFSNAQTILGVEVVTLYYSHELLN